MVSAHIEAAQLPVFFDPTGHRWRRFKFALAAIIVGVVGVLFSVAENSVSSPQAAMFNQTADYPRQLLASISDNRVPVVGGQDGSVFYRIVLVRKADGHTYFADPFSGVGLREATKEEVKVIGSAPFVIEAFGKLRDHELMLTFDDGPDGQYTPELLNLLSREGVPATFFVLGRNAIAHPGIMERISREGHMLANHTMDHIDFDAHGNLRNRAELVMTDRIIRESAHVSTHLFRIPRGDPANNPLALLQSQQLGYIHADFDVDTLDWQYQPGVKVPTPKLDGKGHVVLLHDAGGDRSETVKMVERLIHDAREQGYTFSTMAHLMPPGYATETDVSPTLTDRLTYGVVWSIFILPQVLVGWLFWFGVITMATMSLLYVVLALVSARRQRKRQWPEIPDELWPLVTVILPVYNEEPVVAKTLANLRASDYPRLEVIAVNDGSTDGTLGVLDSFARQWQELLVYDKPNEGKSAAITDALQMARGEIIVTLDGDTIFEPQTIRMLARHFVDDTGHKPVGGVAGRVKVGNPCNVLTSWQSLEYISGICVTRMAEGLVGAISIVPGACSAWRLSAIKQAGGVSHDTLAEDADLTLMIHRLGYRVVQENAAVAWTEAPVTVKSLAKQRLRWTFGNLQALWKHRDMQFKPRFGVLGMVTLPYAMLSIIVPLIFMPLTFVVAGVSLAHGNWQSVAAFAAFVALLHLLISLVAIAIVHENPRHLLAVPYYRLIYEPLRAYLLYASVVQVLRGRALGWYKPERTNTVVLPATLTE